MDFKTAEMYPGLEIEWVRQCRGFYSCYSRPYRMDVFLFSDGDLRYSVSIWEETETRDEQGNLISTGIRDIHNFSGDGGIEFAESEIHKWHKKRFVEFLELTEEFSTQVKEK